MTMRLAAMQHLAAAASFEHQHLEQPGRPAASPALQHIQRDSSSRRRQQCVARCAAASPPPAAAAAAAAPAALCPAVSTLLELEQSCAISSLSQDKLSQEQQERIINMGAAIRALQKDLPAILEREPDLGVLSESILFEDRLSPRLGLPAASCQGRDAYKRLMWSLRFHRTLFFRQAKVELLRMWEREPGVVCVRWSARAAPRLGDLVAASTAEAHVTLDGCSEFHFNDRGLVQKHALDCVSYSGMQLTGLPLLGRMRATQRALVPGLAGGSWDEC